MYSLKPIEDTINGIKFVDGLYKQKVIECSEYLSIEGAPSKISVMELIGIASEAERIVTGIERGDSWVNEKLTGLTPKEQKEKIEENLNMFNSTWALINSQLEKYATEHADKVELTKTGRSVFPSSTELFNGLYLGNVKYDTEVVTLPHKPVEVLRYNEKAGPLLKSTPVPILEKWSLGDYLEKDAGGRIDLSSAENQEDLGNIYKVILNWSESVSGKKRKSYVPLSEKTLGFLNTPTPPKLSRAEKEKYTAVRDPNIVNALRATWTLVNTESGINIAGNFKDSLSGYSGAAKTMQLGYGGAIILETAPREEVNGESFFKTLFRI